MLLKVKVDNNRTWGFLEKYEDYWHYGKGYVKALVGVKADRTLSTPYVYRGGEFISLDKIEEEMGIDRYIKAKKPFYSMIDGCFVVVLKAYVDFNNDIYIPEKSTYEVYVPNISNVTRDGTIALKKVLDVPKEFRSIVEEPLRILGESRGDREKFLRSRLTGGF